MLNFYPNAFRIVSKTSTKPTRSLPGKEPIFNTLVTDFNFFKPHFQDMGMTSYNLSQLLITYTYFKLINKNIQFYHLTLSLYDVPKSMSIEHIVKLSIVGPNNFKKIVIVISSQLRISNKRL